jgi:ATP-dependent Lon protease
LFQHLFLNKFFFFLSLTKIKEPSSDEEMIKLIEEFRTLLDRFLKTMQMDSSTIKNLKQAVETTPISTLIDMMSPVWKLSLSEKISLLETSDTKKRLKLTIDYLRQIISSQNKIQKFTTNKSISNLIGNDDENKEIDLLKKKLEELDLPEETKIKIFRDMKRLERLKPGATEYDVLRTHLELVADVKKISFNFKIPF